MTGKREILWTNLGAYQDKVNAALTEMRQQRVMSRIWTHDHTVWKPEPEGITDRLGWLHIAGTMSQNLERLQALAESACDDGYTHALLLGMGGSSLAPEVFRKTSGTKDGYLDLAVLDSTDPGAVLAHTERLDLSKTLFIVATKSGGTVETRSFFKYFYNQVAQVVGSEHAGAHFVAITDSGSKLDKIAQKYNFRAAFLNDITIGGRYSALSYFGLVPAALIGVDVETLLQPALTMARNCIGTGDVASENTCARLGVAMSELARAGRDKITFVTSKKIASFGDWVEQLVAESTGKDKKGILPVVGEPLGDPNDYGKDRLFVHLRLDGDDSDDAALSALHAAGHPVIRLHLRDMYDLGGQFFLWEMATAVAGHRLGINPFNQPDVDAAKVLAQDAVIKYKEEKVLPTLTPVLTGGDIAVYGDVAAAAPGQALITFLDQAQPYIALQAYVQPAAETDKALDKLRLRLRERYKLATTVGYGPRFLHSTGQLHKGDAGNGLFIQFTADDPCDVPIPDKAGADDSSIDFGVLKMAQALGDWEALRAVGRRVIRFHLGDDVVGGLEQLTQAL